MSATAIQFPLPSVSQLPKVWATQGNLATMRPLESAAAAVHHIQKGLPTAASNAKPKDDEEAISPYAFYRKHTERMLYRYLYASMQVGRTPSILDENVGRGWVSSRKVRTFEDALIFVLDVERCLNRLPTLDRQIISRVLIQQFTHAETAEFMGMSVRSISVKLPQAIDRLTEMLVEKDLLILSD